jgi:hypothetical protein
MSENEDKKKTKEEKILVQIDRTAEMSRLEQEIEDMKTALQNSESEKEELKTALETIAEKEYNAQVKKFQISTEGKSQEEVIEEIKQRSLRENLASGTTSSVYSEGQQTGKIPQERLNAEVEKLIRSSTPLVARDYESLTDMFRDLKKISEDLTHPEHDKAREILDQLTKKATGKQQSYELTGQISDLTRHKKKSLSMEKVKEGD